MKKLLFGSLLMVSLFAANLTASDTPTGRSPGDGCETCSTADGGEGTSVFSEVVEFIASLIS